MLKSATWLLLCLLPLGAALYVYGASLPPYVDAAAAGGLVMAPNVDHGCATDGWYEAMDAVRTWRYPLMNGGAALILFASSVLSVLFFARSPNSWSFSGVVTPSRPAWYFVLGVPTGLAFIWGLSHAFVLELQRQYYPWCADSVIIPIVGVWVGGIIVLMVCAAVAAILIPFFGRLPVPLTQWDAARPRASWLWTLATAVAAVVIIGTIVSSAPEADFLVIPSCVVGLYLVLSTRAALLAPRDGEKATA